MRRFMVDYRFRGRASSVVHAETLEAAKGRIEREVNSDDFDIDADEFDDVNFAVREMHPVTRGERELWTTCVLPSDTRGHASALAESPLFGGPFAARTDADHEYQASR